MSADYVEQTTAMIGRVEGQELIPHAIRLLADGEPVELPRLAAAVGWRLEDVEAALASELNAERDERGRVVGVGLTGHFFSSRAATADWATAHPDGHVYPVEEAFRLDRRVLEDIGWEASVRESR
jgi:hypothetical protein